ncbi:hypothetical protein D3C72_2393440 [compost metagenome]
MPLPSTYFTLSALRMPAAYSSLWIWRASAMQSLQKRRKSARSMYSLPLWRSRRRRSLSLLGLMVTWASVLPSASELTASMERRLLFT